MASLIAAIPQCQTQPIELVYFALAESTSTQCREKKICWLRWKSLGKHWPKRSFVSYLPYMCHMRIFFTDSIQADQRKQTRQLKNKSGFYKYKTHCSILTKISLLDIKRHQIFKCSCQKSRFWSTKLNFQKNWKKPIWKRTEKKKKKLITKMRIFFRDFYP